MAINLYSNPILMRCFNFWFFIGLLSIFVTFQGCDSTNKALTPVAAIVTFGQQPPGGGVCAGNGLCSALSSSSPGASGTKATFSIDPADATMLLLTFKLADLQAQPQLQQKQEAAAILAMTQASAPNPAPYAWVGTFSLSTNSLFAPLNLLPGAQISPTTLVTVTCDGTTVVLHIKYDHQ